MPVYFHGPGHLLGLDDLRSLLWAACAMYNARPSAGQGRARSSRARTAGYALGGVMRGDWRKPFYRHHTGPRLGSESTRTIKPSTHPPSGLQLPFCTAVCGVVGQRGARSYVTSEEARTTVCCIITYREAGCRMQLWHSSIFQHQTPFQTK